jgi:hypothetical protein
MIPGRPMTPLQEFQLMPDLPQFIANNGSLIQRSGFVAVHYHRIVPLSSKLYNT